MATFDELAMENPSIREQYAEWSQARSTNGEDSGDWEAFRQHLQAIGAPDPGGPPDDLA